MPDQADFLEDYSKNGVAAQPPTGPRMEIRSLQHQIMANILPEGTTAIGPETQQVPRRGHILRRSALAFGAMLVMLCVAVWVFRLDIARLLAPRLLARSGVTVEAMTIDRLDLSGLHMRDIRLNSGPIEAAELTLSYSMRHLAEGVLDRVEIIRPRLVITAMGDALSVGGMPLPAAASPGAAAWRIAALKLVEAEIAFDGPGGRMLAAFSIDLALSGSDIGETAFAVDLMLPAFGATQTVHISAPVLSLASQDDGMRLRFGKAAILQRSLPWAIDDLTGEILWRPDRLTATIASGRLTSTRTPAAVMPISLMGNAAMLGQRIDFAVHATIDARGGKSVLRLEATGQYDRASSKGTARVTGPPVQFQAGGLQPRDFAPALGDAVPKLAGSTSVSGSVSWHDAVLVPALVLHLVDIAVEPQGARISKIHGDIAITGFAPPATSAGQKLSGIAEVGGLPPSTATLSFQLQPKPALRIQAMQVDFAGGQLAASPFVIDPARPDFETAIGFKQVDIGEFFKLVSVDGISGTGKLDGQIPLQLSQGKVTIHQGKLTASGPGVLRLGTDVLPKVITEAGEAMTLALQALSDFHYDALEVTLMGSPVGEGTIMLALKGQNPAVLEGQRFNINIKLETNFDRMIDLASRSMAAAQELLRQTTGSTQR